MQPIPTTPEVLDPDRVLDNDRNGLTADDEDQVKLLRKGLEESCGYARQLWNALCAARTYLYESLPSDPRSPGPHPHLSAAPTGPDDSEGWDRWIEVYGGVTSVLCGPHGDSGFGIGEARDAARLRRTAPNLKIAAERPKMADHPGETPAVAPPGRPVRSALRTAALLVAAAAVGRFLGPHRRTSSRQPQSS